MTTDDDFDSFDWNNVAENIVQHSVPTVAIYTNPNGDIVIRRTEVDGLYESGDTWIIIARANAQAAARLMFDLGDGPYEQIEQEQEEQAEPPKKSAAERTRKWRERKRAASAPDLLSHEEGADDE